MFPLSLEKLQSEIAKILDEGPYEPLIYSRRLLVDQLGLSASQLVLRAAEELDVEKCQQLLESARRLSAGEAYDYVLGFSHFYGHRFIIRPDVLIPRPDSEILVEAVEKELEVKPKTSELRILEVGFGSGALSLSLALSPRLRQHRLSIDATDISEQALTVARENTELYADELMRYGRRINWLLTNLLPTENCEYDLIFSNPPYIPLDEYVELDPMVRKFESRLALTDEGDGLSFYRRIAAMASLKKGASIFFECGYNQSEKIKEILEAANYRDIKTQRDYAQYERVISARR